MHGDFALLTNLSVSLVLALVLGLITQLRVFNTAQEDLVYVLAMNRLRAAYVDLDPGIRPYLMMGTTDDLPGSQQTYYAFAARDRSQVFASSMVLILVVHSALVGLFVGALVYTFAASVGWSIGIGLVVAIVAFVGWMAWGYRGYLAVWRLHEPLRASAD